MSSNFYPGKTVTSRPHLHMHVKRGSILFLVLILSLAAYGPRPAHAVTAPPTTCTTSGDFELVIDPHHLVLLPGTSSSPIITITPIDGFTGTVTLETKNVATGLTPSLSATSLDLSTGAKTATLTVSTSSTITSGMTYTLDLNATTTGSLYHDETVSVFVPAPELGIWSDSFFVSVVAGGPDGTDMINLQALYGLTDTSATLTATIPLPPPSSTPPSVSIPSPASFGATASKTTLTVSTTSATTPGYYSVDVSGTTIPGSATNSTSLYVQVTGPGFSLKASPEHLTMASTATAVSTITISSIDGFSSSSVSLTTFSPPGSPSGTLASPTVSLTSASATDVMTVTTSATLPGPYSIIVLAMSGSITNETFVEVIVPGPGFSMSASPSALSLAKGASTPSTSTISLGSELGFAGTVDLTITCFPAGLTASISPTSVSLTASGSGSSTLTVSTYSFTSPGLYVIGIDGHSTSPLASNSTDVLVTVTSAGTGDFGTLLSPGALSITQGSSDISTVTISSTGGFSGTVLLSSLVSPAGPTVTLSSSSILGYGTSTITVRVGSGVSTGTYHVTIIGTSGLLIHSSLLTVTVTAIGAPDFGVSLSSGTLSVKQGNSGTATFTVAASGGFAGTVLLSASVYPAGPTVTLSSSSLSGGSGSSTLTVNVGSGVATGTYTITITATSGSLSHSKQETVTVTSASTQSTASNPPAPIFGLDPTTFYGLVGAIIAVIAIGGAVLALRARRPEKITPTTNA